MDLEQFKQKCNKLVSCKKNRKLKKLKQQTMLTVRKRQLELLGRIMREKGFDIQMSR